MRKIKIETKKHTFEVGEVVEINGDVLIVVPDNGECDACVCYNTGCGSNICDFIDCDGIIFEKIKPPVVVKPLDIPVGGTLELNGDSYQVDENPGECAFGPCTKCNVSLFVSCGKLARQDNKNVYFKRIGEE